MFIISHCLESMDEYVHIQSQGILIYRCKYIFNQKQIIREKHFCQEKHQEQ